MLPSLFAWCSPFPLHHSDNLLINTVPPAIRTSCPFSWPAIIERTISALSPPPLLIPCAADRMLIPHSTLVVIALREA